MARGKGSRNRPPIDPEAAAADAELFASFVRDQARQEREAKAAAKAERRKADEQRQLVKAKEDAAAEVKRLRASDRATAEQKTAADEAYKQALAAVVAAETGEAPAWAPPAPEPEAEGTADADGGDPADATEPAAGEGDTAEAAQDAAPADEVDGDDR